MKAKAVILLTSIVCMCIWAPSGSVVAAPFAVVGAEQTVGGAENEEIFEFFMASLEANAATFVSGRGRMTYVIDAQKDRNLFRLPAGTGMTIDSSFAFKGRKRRWESRFGTTGDVPRSLLRQPEKVAINDQACIVYMLGSLGGEDVAPNVYILPQDERGIGGEVVGSRIDPKALLVPFGGTMARLREFMSPESGLGMHAEVVRVEQQPDGLYFVELRFILNEEAQAKHGISHFPRYLWVDPTRGYNVVREAVYNTPDGPPVSEVTREFNAYGDEWFLKSMTWTQLESGTKEVLSKTTISITDFEPNVEIADEEFELGGLGIPAGLLVYDRIIGSTYTYGAPNLLKDLVEKELPAEPPFEEVSESSHEMPETELSPEAERAKRVAPGIPTVGTVGQASPWSRQWITWLVGLCGVGALAGYLALRARRKRPLAEDQSGLHED